MTAPIDNLKQQMLTQQQAIARLNSRKWRQIPDGWSIEIEDLIIEAREENARWRARARPTAASGEKPRWSYWSPALSTRWRAALAARGLVREQQGILPL